MSKRSQQSNIPAPVNKQGAQPIKLQAMAAKHSAGSSLSRPSNIISAADHTRRNWLPNGIHNLHNKSSYQKFGNQNRPGRTFGASGEAESKQSSFRKGNGKAKSNSSVGDLCLMCIENFDPSEIKEPLCNVCGYKVCVFCYHKIKNIGDGLCPQCRTPYPENPQWLAAL